MSAFTVDYDLPKGEHFDRVADERRYRIIGVRVAIHGSRAYWGWLGYSCWAAGEDPGDLTEVVLDDLPDQAMRVRVLRDVRGDLNRFDLETAKP